MYHIISAHPSLHIRTYHILSHIRTFMTSTRTSLAISLSLITCTRCLSHCCNKDWTLRSSPREHASQSQVVMFVDDRDVASLPISLSLLGAIVTDIVSLWLSLFGTIDLNVDKCHSVLSSPNSSRQTRVVGTSL